MKKLKITEGQLSLWDIKVPSEPVKEKSSTSCETVESNIVKKYMDNALKIIKTCAGRYVVYLENGSIHFTGTGEKDFYTETHPPVLPIDTILYSKIDEEVNKKQKRTLLKVKEEYEVINIVKRHGDKNYIVITKDETLAINPKGWILNFKGEAIYKDEEVIKDREIVVGDTVKVQYEGKDYIGEVCRIYGPGDCTLNIIFGDKHTAFYRDCVKLVG